MPISLGRAGERSSRGHHNSSLLSRISSLNCP